jgi:hypothetical protein
MASYTAIRTLPAITLLAAAIIGSLPWIRLAFRKPGSRRGRVTAILIVSLSAIAVVWIALGLPRAYEFQRRFNEMSVGPDSDELAP